MLKFAVCPHDTYGGIDRWEEFALKLQSLTGDRVELVTFRSFREEEEKLRTERFDVYYASPGVALELYRRGYVPVAKLKGQEDTLLFVGKEITYKGKYVIALADLEAVKFGLLPLERMDFSRIRIVYTETHEETFGLIESGAVDYGVVYKDNFERYGGENLNVVEEVKLGTSHLFMVRREICNELKDKILSLPGVVRARKADLFRIVKFDRRLRRFLRRWQEHDIAQAVLSAPAVGVLIYQEGVVYVNDYLCELLGYEREELKGMPVYELVADEERDRIREIVKRRLAGERFTSTYRELKLKRKDGVELWVNVFSSTILYEGEYSGFVIAVDITKKKQLERLYALLREVNQAITESVLEEELFQKVCKALIEKMGLRFAWIGEPNDEGWIVPVSKCGCEEGYLEKAKISINPGTPEGRGPTGTALREGRIVINPDTRSNPAMGPWREEMLKRGYLSSCAIPLQVEGETVYVLNLYSSEPLYFQEENKEILKELKHDIEFSLKRLREFRKGLIISKALELSHDWVLVTDSDGNILYVNEAVCNISGYSRGELLGNNPRMFKSGLHSQDFYKDLWETILSGRRFHAIFVNRKRDGELFYLEQTIVPIELPDRRKRFVSVGRDVTRELEMSEEIEKLKFYDALTGLPNFNNFSLKVSEKIKGGNRVGALVLLDINNMSLINSNYGFQIGDRILKEVANRLVKTFRDYDLVAKVGGDEFALFIYPMRKREDALVVTEKLKEVFREPVRVNGLVFALGINAGVSVFPLDGKTFHELYEKASLALRMAKVEGENEIRFFDKEMEKKAESFVRAESLLERAIRDRLFVYEFQPYFRLEDMSVAGLELLLRIKEEDGTLHYPAEFIDYLENSRFLPEFEKRSIREVRRILSKFEVPVSLNVSAKSFKNEKYMRNLTSLAKDFPGRLVVEITERLLVEDVERTKEILGGLRKFAKAAVDDFGTGYSSLSYLKDLPVDIVKIDMSFVRGMVENERDKALVEVIVEFTNRIGMESLAEGVETRQQLELLKDIGCTYAQGFYLARPMPEESVERLLKGEK